jgi:hypothetical protein
MSMPPSPPPTPKILNFVEAQSINAAADFTLQWNGFAGAGPQDHISMYLSDTNGNVVFQAPDPCIPRELPVTATSVLIPANTLRSNQTYQANILFGRVFYNSTNDVPGMAGYGDIIRNTRFAVATGTGGSVTPVASSLSEVRLLPNGNPQFTLGGTVGASYRIERTANLINGSWQNLGTVTVLPLGTISFEDTQNPKTFPLFYRAVSN